jgi:hypothetical protein
MGDCFGHEVVPFFYAQSGRQVTLNSVPIVIGHNVYIVTFTP